MLYKIPTTYESADEIRKNAEKVMSVLREVSRSNGDAIAIATIVLAEVLVAMISKCVEELKTTNCIDIFLDDVVATLTKIIEVSVVRNKEVSSEVM